jgi:hypothetical protein
MMGSQQEMCKRGREGKERKAWEEKRIRGRGRADEYDASAAGNACIRAHNYY